MSFLCKLTWKEGLGQKYRCSEGKVEDSGSTVAGGAGCDDGLGEIIMSELHCVEDLCHSDGFFHHCVEAVVLQRYTNIPAGCTAEVRRISCPCLFVCDWVASEGSGGCSVIIEQSVEV